MPDSSKTNVSSRIIVAAVIVLVVVVGGIFVLIAKLTGDTTADQEGVLRLPREVVTSVVVPGPAAAPLA